MLFSYRFLYGLRAVIPFLIGMTGCSLGRFMLFGSAGALVWSIAITAAGLACGKFLLFFISNLQRYQLWFVGFLGILGIVFWAIYHFKQRHTD